MVGNEKEQIVKDMTNDNENNKNEQNTKELKQEHLEWISQIARDSIFEPFEGGVHLENIRQAMTYLEEKSSKLKSFFESPKTKAGFEKLRNTSRDKIRQIAKLGWSSSNENDDTDIPTPLKQIYAKMEETIADIKGHALQTYTSMGERAKAMTKSFVLKAFDSLLNEDAEQWILLRAGTVLTEKKFQSLEEISQISVPERQKMMEAFYPYDSPAFKQYLQKLDVSINLGLGTIAASNIPMTGTVVSLVNMAKTIVKIGNRLHILCAIYGRQIVSSTALLHTCALIVSSISETEGAPKHVPLNPNILDALFSQNPSKKDNLKELVNALFKKDAYMAIPGVGMVSLGKIQLDDYKIDLVIQHLVVNYFHRKELESIYGENLVTLTYDRFRFLFAMFAQNSYFPNMREQLEKEQQGNDESKWYDNIRNIVGKDVAFLDFSEKLNSYAWEIFQQTATFSDTEFENVAKEEIEKLMGTTTK